MDFGTGLKIAVFLFWPFLLLFVYYLVDKKGFKRLLEKSKRGSK
jgi:hypothetical protein